MTKKYIYYFCHTKFVTKNDSSSKTFQAFHAAADTYVCAADILFCFHPDISPFRIERFLRKRVVRRECDSSDMYNIHMSSRDPSALLFSALKAQLYPLCSLVFRRSLLHYDVLCIVSVDDAE